MNRVWKYLLGVTVAANLAIGGLLMVPSPVLSQGDDDPYSCAELGGGVMDCVSWLYDECEGHLECYGT